MGNYASCVLGEPQGKYSRVARVIFPSGEIKQFRQPTKVAELMLEIPNYFVINSKSLHIGKRFLPLNADEDLENGNVYVMFPMQRVNSFVNTKDMGAIYLATKRGSSLAGKVRVVPASAEEVNEVEELVVSEFQHRIISVSRSRKPLLETIVEEST